MSIGLIREPNPILRPLLSENGPKEWRRRSPQTRPDQTTPPGTGPVCHQSYPRASTSRVMLCAARCVYRPARGRGWLRSWRGRVWARFGIASSVLHQCCCRSIYEPALPNGILP